MNIISNDGRNKLNRSRKARVSYKVQRTINASLNAFFFQAEDGIRDLTVTGVQTCALPIWLTQQAQSKNLAADKTTAIIDRFDKAVQVQAASRIDTAKEEVGKIAALYNQSSLQLLASPYPDSFGDWLGVSGDAAGRHFLGMI